MLICWGVVSSITCGRGKFSADDGLQICPKHVEVDWRNKLRLNFASSWFSLHGTLLSHIFSLLLFSLFHLHFHLHTMFYTSCHQTMTQFSCSSPFIIFYLLHLYRYQDLHFLFIPPPPPNHYQREGIPSVFFPSGSPTKILCAYLFSPMHDVCPDHLILLYF